VILILKKINRLAFINWKDIVLFSSSLKPMCHSLALCASLLSALSSAAGSRPEARTRAATSCVQTVRLARLQRRGHSQKGHLSPRVDFCLRDIIVRLSIYLSSNLASSLSCLQITETENMMDRIVSGLSESSIKVRLAAVRYELPVPILASQTPSSLRTKNVTFVTRQFFKIYTTVQKFGVIQTISCLP